MRKTGVSKFLFAFLFLVTTIFAVVHLTQRSETPEGHIRIEYRSEETQISLAELPLEQVRGTKINGKGERTSINSAGIELSAFLEIAGVEDFSTVTALSEDVYSAELSYEEIMKDNNIYLLIAEEERPSLVVFEDANSKRAVKDVSAFLIL